MPWDLLKGVGGTGEMAGAGISGNLPWDGEAVGSALTWPGIGGATGTAGLAAPAGTSGGVADCWADAARAQEKAVTRTADKRKDMGVT